MTDCWVVRSRLILLKIFWDVLVMKGCIKKYSEQHCWSPSPTSNIPMTALGSVPKAHTHGEPEGTWNLEKLHLELKYLGRKLADAKLQRKGNKTRMWGRTKHQKIQYFIKCQLFILYLRCVLTTVSRYFELHHKFSWLTLTVCSFWGPLLRRCALCHGHWTHR